MTMQENKKSVAASAGTADGNTKSIKTDIILSSDKEVVNSNFNISTQVDLIACDLECSMDLIEAFVSLYELEGEIYSDPDYNVVKNKAVVYVTNLKKYMSILYSVRNSLNKNMRDLSEIATILLKER